MLRKNTFDLPCELGWPENEHDSVNPYQVRARSAERPKQKIPKRTSSWRLTIYLVDRKQDYAGCKQESLAKAENEDHEPKAISYTIELLTIIAAAPLLAGCSAVKVSVPCSALTVLRFAAK